jgi:SAM-dependent methyltransferase
MSMFGSLAHFYDLIYANKDYRAEAQYVLDLLDTHGDSCRDILELGSGTGRHALELASFGRQVHGIDASPDMTALANKRLSSHTENKVSFQVASAMDYRAGRHFDAVIACFHVLNYMTSQQTLIQAFKTASAHLNRGGLFLFDSWHGPAVQATGPETRVQDIADGSLDIVRIAQPTHDANNQRVDVRYRFFVRERALSHWELIEELHQLRYLFQDNVASACEASGLELVLDQEWLTGHPLSDKTWGACYLARKT